MRAGCGLVAMLIGAGCASEEASFVTSLEGTRALSSLSTEERADVCEQQLDFVDDVYGSQDEYMRRFCSWLGLITNQRDASVTCESERDRCLAETPPLGDQCLRSLDVPAGCRATVADIEACQSTLGPAFEMATASSSCALAGDPAAIAAITSASTPDACAPLLDPACVPE